MIEKLIREKEQKEERRHFMESKQKQRKQKIRKRVAEKKEN